MKQFVELALKTLSCNQKELARRLRVSATQISNWKNDEYMSTEMQDKFRSLLKIGHHFPGFVLYAGSVEAADKWEKLFLYLANLAVEGGDTGFDVSCLTEEPDLLSALTTHTLRKMGVSLPEVFPAELDIDYDAMDDSVDAAIEANPYSLLLGTLYRHYVEIYGFYEAYIGRLDFNGRDDEAQTMAHEIHVDLLDLAATKMSPDSLGGLVSNFENFQFLVRDNFRSNLNFIKERAFAAGLPLGAELMNLVDDPSGSLGREAEFKHFGFDRLRLHPDVYMNEILTGVREIRRALPAILAKLGIAAEGESEDPELEPPLPEFKPN